VSPASLRFDSSSWAQEQELLVMTGDDQQAQLPAPFEIILRLSRGGGTGGGGSSGGASGDSGSQELVVSGRRMDDDLHTGGCWPASARAACCCLHGCPSVCSMLPPQPTTCTSRAGNTPQQPFQLNVDEQAECVADGALLLGAASPGGAAVQLGQPLAGLGAALRRPRLGSIAYYSISTSLTINITLSACSAEAPLQVAIFAGGTARW
jgi:hypothetical protein